MVRVRIAPSPTGFLHVGTARTALYNFLFARNKKGKFILRIEDTDIERSSDEMVNVIIESLKWMGLHWNEGPYFQSERRDIYRKYADKLLQVGLVYPCYCTKEEIEERRERVIEKKKAWKYDRRCLYLTQKEKEQFESKKAKALRFKVEKSSSFEDLLHGKIERSKDNIEDFVIVKSDGMATYNFACVIDDHLMEITHVIRGEDHISNTHKQTLLYEAFGWAPPEFVHLPLILGPDRAKLSKRHGAISVLEYRDKGFLPEAFVNFLALLGWSPGNDREIISFDEMIELFSLERVGKRGAVFDIKKLEWMNGEYIKAMNNSELLHRLLPFIEDKPGIEEKEEEYILHVIGLLKERLFLLSQFWELGSYFFIPPEQYDIESFTKYVKKGRAETKKEKIEEVIKTFKELKKFDREAVEYCVRGVAEGMGIKAGLIIHPIRFALTGKTFGPGLFELMEILGREKCIKRLEYFVENIIPQYNIKN
ncbi:MAG: glutamate--tRNA ligase [bacterium (Candidatus Stahlbacteria) CG23_combo_of_CG06-09_8_20_14_all_40_9]|nr:MAG: glutamate--tRNA ligase [bacterium (Candidatus Stahlbacteria) CG23_combo_of_CG06-09_8_20_14_all_40_9]